ncbi:helix-turn-helix transcriptional regulator [Methanobacterium oryzae]|uniref:helix-turn-helix transcriptional regulator n=1 Tax=Methanobacterium oryzae TaxID=69540 RepID=UPI003D1DE11A
MNTETIIKFYESIKDDLKFHSISSVRVKIMISLNEEPMKTKDLRKLIGIQSSTIIHGIKELEKQNLVSRRGDYYYLSETGKIMALKLIDIIRTLITLKNFEKLWLNHEIDSIPNYLLNDIGYLSNLELVESEKIDIFRPHGAYMQVILRSKKIKGVSPIFYPDYVNNFKNMIENGISVELILTSTILRKTIGSIDPNDLAYLTKVLSEETLKIWEIEEEVKVAFTITDKFTVLGLFFLNGSYDSTKLLIGDHDDAIIWSNRLFEYYRGKANKFIL